MGSPSCPFPLNTSSEQLPPPSSEPALKQETLSREGQKEESLEKPKKEKDMRRLSGLLISSQELLGTEPEVGKPQRATDPKGLSANQIKRSAIRSLWAISTACYNWFPSNLEAGLYVKK